MKDSEMAALNALRDVVTKILENKEDPILKDIVKHMLIHFDYLGCSRVAETGWHCDVVAETKRIFAEWIFCG